MASQEHLQQMLDNDDDDSSHSSTSNSDNEGTSAVAGPFSASIASPFRLPSSIHPKKRLKLSMKLSAHTIGSESATPVNDQQDAATTPQALSINPPSSSSSTLPPSKPRASTPPPPRPRLNKRSLPIKKKKLMLPPQDNNEGEINAMIVDSDGDDDAVATAVAEAPVATAMAVKYSSTPPPPKKKPTTLTPRNVRLPPFSSPGLLLPANNSVTTIRGKPATEDANTNNGLTTMASVFELYMNMVGYTEETRTKRPHIGSSVKRQVGDMFDSNVQFSLHFPKLVPEDLLPAPDSENKEAHHSLAESLISAFDTTKSNANANRTPETQADAANGSSKKETPKKRRKLIQYSDMIPPSLTLPYPEWYIQQQLAYVELINEREQAILAYQKAVEALELESHDVSREDNPLERRWKKLRNAVPPIPRPPSPPQLEHLPALNKDQFDDSQHPLYPPKAKQLVAHLDTDCFHITEGRYFGLTCNSIADPHFVGPSAPGISGLNSTSGNGLATAHSGGGPNTGGLSIQPTPINGTSNKSSSTKKVPNSSSSSTVSKKKKKKTGLATTATSSALRKLMEEGGEEADRMKTCVIRAAVHASRSRRHSQAFQAPNGEIYPEVHKAFAAHAGLKPCIRCMGNKQGTYQCRLRRKHKDLDYDGGDSSGLLAPLSQVPLEDLLWKPKP